MNLSPYIAYLLYRHDCVIVPGLGAFLAHYVPASYDFIHQQISPPVRTIAFNSSLKASDGLLANCISRENKVSFEQAGEWVEQWVRTCKSLLHSGHAVNLDYIGTLLAEGERMEFTPISGSNFYLQTIHFPPVPAIVVSREKEWAKIDETPVFIPETAELPDGKMWRYAAVFLPFLLLAGLFSYNYIQSYQRASTLDTASVVPVVSQHSSAAPEVQPEMNAVDSFLQSEIDSNILAENNTTHTTSSESAPVPEASDMSPTSDLSWQEGSPGFYIIIGAFGQPANVERACEKIKNELGENRILTVKSTKLTKVGFFAGQDQLAAETRQSEIRASYPDSWIYAINP